ncbi:MAG TPA: hypothetical protein VIF37_19195 [Methylobacter sp.]|jgi:hypothetical protein
MGLVSFLFGGGNAGLIAKSIATHHHRLGKFNDVLNIYYRDFKSRSNGSKNYAKAQEAIEMIDNRHIRNYRDLAVLALMVDAAPSFYQFHEIEQDFSGKLIKSLTKNGIDMNHIAGDVLTLSI